MGRHASRRLSAWGRRPGPLLTLVQACVLAAVAAGITVNVTVACPGCGPGPRLGVRVAGDHLVNAAGATIRLLGVNRSGAEYACIRNLGLFAGPTGTQAIAAMTSWRINAVRVPLNEDCWLGVNGVPDRWSGTRYRSAIRAYVARLNDAGLYVILDLHWNAPGKERATGQRMMADLSHAPAFWSSVARVFRTNPAVMFDLYNEPNGISWRCWLDGCVVPGGWKTAGMQKLVDTVRSAGARQPVIATGLDWGNDLSSWLRYRPHDPAGQLVAGFHAYSSRACVTRRCWNGTVKPVAHSVPVVTTELGETGCSHTFINSFMDWADAAGVSYLGWSWNPSGCNAPALIRAWGGQPTAYGEGLRAHLLHLRVPRPRATAQASTAHSKTSARPGRGR